MNNNNDSFNNTEIHLQFTMPNSTDNSQRFQRNHPRWHRSDPEPSDQYVLHTTASLSTSNIAETSNGDTVNSLQARLRTVLVLDGESVERRRFPSMPVFAGARHGDNSDVSNVPHSRQMLRHFVVHQGSNLFLEAILLLLCQRQHSDIESQQNLFDYMRRQFQQLNVLQPITSNGAITVLRDQCCHALNALIWGYRTFSELPSSSNQNVSLISARDSFLDQMMPSDPLMELVNDWLPYSLFCVPRYRCDFEQFEKLGQGGYGRVYRVESKMDKREYAVKKIRLSSKEPKCLTNVQREVEVFARLKHPNIVEYVTSWLEHSLGSDNFDASPSNSCSSCTSDESGSALGYDLTGDGNDGKSGCLNCGATIKEVHDISVVQIASSRLPLWATNLEEEKKKESNPSSFNTKLTANALHPLSAAYVDGRHKKSTGFTVTLYIQMELCSKTLNDWIVHRNSDVLLVKDRFEVVDSDESDRIFRQILTAVQYIHSEHLMHRDLNPKNIFVNEKQCVKIGDFGLARREWGGSVEELARGDGPPTPLNMVPVRMTSDIGTTMYSAPEQLDGSNYDQKADIYSLGLIEFELFYPFGTDMERNKLIWSLRNCNGFSKDIVVLKERFPAQVDVIRAVLNREPSLRPTATDLLMTMMTTSEREAMNDHLVADLRKMVIQLRSSLSSKCDYIEKQAKQIKVLKRALHISHSKITTLTKKINSPCEN